MGITHILNTAEGSRFGQVDTGHAYYRDVPSIRYMYYNNIKISQNNFRNIKMCFKTLIQRVFSICN